MPPKKRQRISTPTFSSDPVDPEEPGFKEWRTPKRARVKQLKIEHNTAKEIEKKTGVPERSQYRIYEAPTRRPGKERSGRPPKIDKDTIEKMVKSLKGYYHNRTQPWEQLAESFFQNTICWRTVKNHMNKAGYHKCRACQKSWINDDQRERRLHWCERHIWPDWKWRMVRRLYVLAIQIADVSLGLLV